MSNEKPLPFVYQFAAGEYARDIFFTPPVTTSSLTFHSGAIAGVSEASHFHNHLENGIDRTNTRTEPFRSWLCEFSLTSAALLALADPFHRYPLDVVKTRV
jgi:hypothetical protein